MAIPEVNHLWTFTSTGVGDRIAGLSGREWTFHVELPVGSTGEVEIQVAREASSTSVGIVVGSSQALASSGGTGVVLQFSGPFSYVFPRCIKLTASGTMQVRGVAT